MEGLAGATENMLSGLIGGGIGMGPGLLDMILLGVVGVGVVRGYLRGGLQQAGSVGGVLLGIWAGATYATEASELIGSYIRLPRSVDTEIGFIVVLAATRLLVRVGGETLGEAMEAFGMGSVNKGVGGLIGGYKAALLTSLLLLVGAELGIPNTRVQSQSQWYSSVRQVLPATWNAARSVVPEIGAMRNMPGNLLHLAETRAQSLGASVGGTYGNELAGGKMRIEEDYTEPFSEQRNTKAKRARRTAGVGGIQDLAESLGESLESILGNIDQGLPAGRKDNGP